MYSLLIKNLTKHICFTTEELMLITTAYKPRRLKKKEFLLHQGEISRYENFVSKGCLRAFNVNEKGEEHIIQFAVEDWWIGDMYSFLTGTPSTLYIQALEDCELLQIDKPSLEELYLKVPKLERFFRILIQNAFITSQHRVLSSMSKTADERYLDFIRKYPTLEQRLSQYQIAAYLGVTPEFLSRIRKNFTKQLIS